MIRHAPIITIFFIQAVAGGGLLARIPDIQRALDLDASVLGLALSASR